MATINITKYAELIIGMSSDFLNSRIDENHYVNELSNISKLLNTTIKPYQTNNGETIQVFVQFGSVVLERVGKSFYLNAMGETYRLTEDKVKEILIGLLHLFLDGQNTL